MPDAAYNTPYVVNPDKLLAADVEIPVIRPYVSTVIVGIAEELPYVPAEPGLNVTVGKSDAVKVPHVGAADTVPLPVWTKKFLVAVVFPANRAPAPLAPP